VQAFLLFGKQARELWLSSVSTLSTSKKEACSNGIEGSFVKVG